MGGNEVNGLACQQRACHVHKRGKGSGRALTQVRDFTIFDKRAQGLYHQTSRLISFSPPEDKENVAFVFT
jgi:hypothetical protein